MATETLPSDHSTTTPEQVEKEVHEEVQTIEQHTSPTKSGEEDQPKAEESPSPAAPLVKPEEKIKDKEVEPPVIEEVKETEQGEKPKAEDSPSLEVPSAESEEKTEDKEIEPPAVEEVKKTDEEQEPKAEDSVYLSESAKETEDKKTEAVVVEEVNKGDNNLVEDVPVEETEGAGEDPAPQPPSVSEPEVQPVIETAEEQPKEEPTIECTRKKAEEQPKLVEVPESSVEAVGGKEEPVEESIFKGAEEVAAKDDVEKSEAEVKKEETVEAIPVVQEKPQEQSEVTEPVETESAAVKLKEGSDSKIGVDEETLADKVEDGKAQEVKEPAKAVPLVPVSSDQVASTEQAELDTKVENLLYDVAEKPIVEALEVKEKELNGSNAGETVSKEKVVEPGKVEAEKDIKDVKSEEGEKKVVNEESNEPETKIGEIVNSSTSTPEVTEKPLEGECTSREIEFIAENGKETVKDGFTAIEKTKDEIVKKVDKVTTAATNEPKESEATLGVEETSQTGEEKQVKEKEADDNVKPGVPNTESEDGDDTKTSQDPPKEEIQAKSTQKHSSNILSKVKQSLVKAKKAIIGKSPNSKMPSEAKAEHKTKQ